MMSPADRSDVAHQAWSTVALVRNRYLEENSNVRCHGVQES